MMTDMPDGRSCHNNGMRIVIGRASISDAGPDRE
jgi:hypothetical protein